MIKLVYCLKRLPRLSREEFQDYWFNTHGPLVRKHRETLRIRRYVQVHAESHELNDALREGRGGPPGYDGVAELWWDSADDLMAALSTPEGQRAGEELLDDEKKFIDLAQSPLWVSTERPVID